MKILHTADLHIRGFNDPRWKTLEILVEIAEEESVDILVISGDLIDTEVAAEEIRVELRDLFSGNPFHTLIIPGNHDMEAYSTGFYPGEDATFLSSKKIKENVFDTGDALFVGLPFQNLDFVGVLNLLNGLAEWLPEDRIIVLLFHGELLDAFYSREDFGSEGDRRYMPARLSFFQELPISYVLAGHFHSRFDVLEITPGRYFVYPGSPISITRRELGRRRINLFELGKRPKSRDIDTPHFEEIRITLFPGDEEDLAQLLLESIAKAHSEATILLTIDGFIEKEEIQFLEEIRSMLVGKSVEINYRVRDLGKIISDPLYASFTEVLNEERHDDATVKEIQQMVIQAMIEARV